MLDNYILLHTTERTNNTLTDTVLCGSLPALEQQIAQRNFPKEKLTLDFVTLKH